jgi:hypothetical protein
MMFLVVIMYLPKRHCQDQGTGANATAPDKFQHPSLNGQARLASSTLKLRPNAFHEDSLRN